VINGRCIDVPALRLVGCLFDCRHAMQQVLSIAAAIPLYQFEQRQILRGLDVLRGRC
jgi:hypothetical protein